MNCLVDRNAKQFVFQAVCFYYAYLFPPNLLSYSSSLLLYCAFEKYLDMHISEAYKKEYHGYKFIQMAGEGDVAEQARCRVILVGNPSKFIQVN